MDELDICYICNNPEIEPSVCLDCYHKNYLKGRREGAIAELKLIIKRNSNFKYSRLDMIEFCEKRLKKLQGGGE